MKQSAFTDVDDAYTEFSAYVETFAAAKGWSADDKAEVLTDVSTAYANASHGLLSAGLDWAGVTDSCKDFWQDVYNRGYFWTGKDADKLRAVAASALETMGVIAESTVTSSDIVVGTVTKSAEDVHDAGSNVGKAIANPYFWPAVGAIAVVVAIVAAKR